MILGSLAGNLQTKYDVVETLLVGTAWCTSLAVPPQLLYMSKNWHPHPVFWTLLIQVFAL